MQDASSPVSAAARQLLRATRTCEGAPAKDRRHEQHLAQLAAKELSLGGIRHPSPALLRAHADYLRLREARNWLRRVEPENDIGLAMVDSDLARAEERLRRLIAQA